jgi:hypothetical protein
MSLLLTLVGVLVGVKLIRTACEIETFIGRCSRPVFLGLCKQEGTYYD